MKITRYKVILPNGSAEYGSEQVAIDYAALVGSAEIVTVEYEVPDAE